MPKLRVIPRSEWGAGPCTWEPQYANVTRLIVHHTAGWETSVRAIWEHHAAKWGDIGYNYVVLGGQVYEGRYGGNGVVGGHTLPANIGSCGVAVRGNYDEREPDAGDLEALAWIIAVVARQNHLDPASSTTGHRDHDSTACPGRYLYARLPEVRGRARTILSDPKPAQEDDMIMMMYVAGIPNTIWVLDWSQKTKWGVPDPTTFVYLRDVIGIPFRGTCPIDIFRNIDAKAPAPTHTAGVDVQAIADAVAARIDLDAGDLEQIAKAVADEQAKRLKE